MGILGILESSEKVVVSADYYIPRIIWRVDYIY